MSVLHMQYRLNAPPYLRSNDLRRLSLLAPTCRRSDFIASGGAGGELRVWDLASREMVVHLKHHSLSITDLKVRTYSCALLR